MVKTRTLKELYSATKSISEPKITPVLRGICGMRGPVEETNTDTRTNTASPQGGNGSGCCLMSQKVHNLEVSGNCNVCAAPCSSCMHVNRTLMGLKDDDFLDETSHRDTDSQYSNCEVPDSPHIKSLRSVTSSHTPDLGKLENRRGIEGHDDNSFVSESNDANIVVKSEDVSVDKNNKLCRLASSSQRKQPDFAVECIYSSLTREAESGIVSCQKSEIEPDEDTKKLDDEDDMLESPLQSISDSKTDDLVDVDVCDICGDAGREDSLVVCTRCSEGAEHIYCMYVRLHEVPKGEWLCYECSLIDETEKNKQVKSSVINGDVIKESSELNNYSDMEANRKKKVIQSTHFSSKRPLENIDVDLPVKRQSLITSANSPKAYSPHKTAALSRDSSFKNFDKGKTKLAHQMPFGISTTSSRSQKSKGNLLKSNSFNTFGNNQRVKPTDDVIPHKQRGGRELGSFESKEGPSKVMSKSSSFKSTSLTRSTAPESKVKMLSPRFPHFQDTRELKKSKENTIERKKSACLAASSTVSSLKGDEKVNSCGESILDSNFVPNLIIPKEETTISSKYGAEEGPPLLEESTNHIENSCHATNISSTATPRESFNDPVMNEDNKLKAAIQAAMRRKPGLIKSRVPDQCDGLNSVIASQDQLPISNNFSNIKHVTAHPTDSIYSLKTDAMIPSDGKSDMRDGSAMMPALAQSSAVPEHAYIWQGDFEVQRSGHILEMCAGIQAHLSTCASPKVVEMVKKFVQRVPLTEVSRLSTWPTQFHGCGPTEDHIALYFFAKDVESYERNYRRLVDSMIKKDVALKATFDGVELLIFPSNQLPKRSQRWNMFFFLWGVFRAKRVNSPAHMLNPVTKVNASFPVEKDYTSAVVSFPENPCLPKLTREESSLSRILAPETIHTPQEANKAEKFKLDPELQPHNRPSSFYRGMSTYHAIPKDPQENLFFAVKTGGIEKVIEKNVKDAEEAMIRDVSINRMKRSFSDITETASRDFSSCKMDQKPPNTVELSLGGEESSNKKLKTFGNDFDINKNVGLGLSSSEDHPERHFFPVGQTSIFRNSLPHTEPVSNQHLEEVVPNLDLALGAEFKPPSEQVHLPLFIKAVDKGNDSSEKPTDKLTTNLNEDDDIPASLSLSLSYPYGL